MVTYSITDATIAALRAAARGKSLNGPEHEALCRALDTRRTEFEAHRLAKREAVCSARNDAARAAVPS